MTVNIVMLVRNRPNLTRQALDSLFDHTERGAYNLTVVDDASEVQTRGILDMAASGKDYMQVVRLWRTKGIVGLVRNLGIRAAETYWGRGDFLYLSDNDAYFTPGWLERMIAVYLDVWLPQRIRLLGGYTHPYHQPIAIHGSVAEHDAIGGFSQLMGWDMWDKYGPFDAHAVGVCQSEDWLLCQKIRADGFKVGCVVPHVVYNCGLTNSLGQPAVGHEAMVRVPGVLFE